MLGKSVALTGAIGERNARWRLGLRQQRSHRHAQFDVDDVVARPPSVGEACGVAREDAERLLVAWPVFGAIEVFSRIISEAVTLAG